MLGCKFERTDIFCTLDHSAIHTGEDFRNEIVKNMKGCDFILCMISENYKRSEVCTNEMGAAWAMDGKRILSRMAFNSASDFMLSPPHSIQLRRRQLHDCFR